MINYDPLWRTMKKKNITTYTLRHKYNINSETINRMRHNRPVTTTTLNDFCNILDCKIEDILEFVKDEK